MALRAEAVAIDRILPVGGTACLWRLPLQTEGPQGCSLEEQPIKPCAIGVGLGEPRAEERRILQHSRRVARDDVDKEACDQHAGFNGWHD